MIELNQRDLENAPEKEQMQLLQIHKHLKDVEKEWSKIKAIETEEKYNKNCNGVFTSNIKRGSDFLANFSGIFILILTLN